MKRLLLSLFVLSVSGSAFSQEWIEQNSNLPGVSRGTNGFDAVNASIVWAQGYYGGQGDPETPNQEFTRTTDGGETWIPGFIELFDPELGINNISAIDGTTAFVSAINGDLGGGGVYKTTDGGENWDPSNPGGYLASASFVNVVYFWDANIGISQGDPIGGGAGEFEIYRTTDGGANWTLVPGTSIDNPANGEYGYNGGNVSAGNSFWYVTNFGNIYRTTDMGLTYQKFDTPLTDFSATATGGQLFFSNDLVGMLVRRTGAFPTYNAQGVRVGNLPTYTVFRTFDGGTTWDAGAPYSGNLDSANFVYIPNTTTIVATSLNFRERYGSEYSNDNGLTWNIIDSEVQRGEAVFVDGSTGWCGGFTGADQTIGGIFKFEGTLALNNVVANNTFSATPNPTNGIMELSNENAAIANVTVFDLLGKQVYNAKFSALNNVTLDLSALTTGAYIMKATDTAGASQSIKIMKN